MEATPDISPPRTTATVAAEAPGLDSPVFEFDRAIAVTVDATEPGTFAGQCDAGWQVGGGINGGLLLAVLGNALRTTFAPHGHRDPFTISAYYLTASSAGPTTLRTQTLRRGRGLSTGAVSLSQYDASGAPAERARALATFGNLDDLPSDVHTTAQPPDLPPPESCVDTSAAPPHFLAQAAMLDRLDLRLAPDSVGWAVGQPSHRGQISGWLRLADGREPDPLMLMLAVDVLPPVTFDLGLPGWAPTLELTAHVRARPAPGWLRVRHATRNFAGGMLEEDCEVWDSTDRLVAQSRQLALAPRPH